MSAKETRQGGIPMKPKRRRKPETANRPQSRWETRRTWMVRLLAGFIALLLIAGVVLLNIYCYNIFPQIYAYIRIS